MSVGILTLCITLIFITTCPDVYMFQGWRWIFFKLTFAAHCYLEQETGFWHPQLLLLISSDEDRNSSSAAVLSFPSRRRMRRVPQPMARTDNKQLAGFRAIPALPHAPLHSYTDSALSLP